MADEQQLSNQITLLKLALEYYAEEANYLNNQIINDKGTIARNTLKTLSIIDAEMKQSEEAYQIKIQQIKDENNMENEDADELTKTLTKLVEINKRINL